MKPNVHTVIAVLGSRFCSSVMADILLMLYRGGHRARLGHAEAAAGGRSMVSRQPGAPACAGVPRGCPVGTQGPRHEGMLFATIPFTLVYTLRSGC